MAKVESEKKDESAPENRDLLVTSLMACAALVAVAGFGVLFSIWWRTGKTPDPFETLRIASREYVAGRPTVAGELASTVTFEWQEAAAELAGGSATSDDTKPPEDQIADRSGGESDPATPSEAEWIQLREFLVGAGIIAKAQESDDPRAQRELLFAAIPHLEKARQGGFPEGRQADGYRLLGDALFYVGRFDEATDAIAKAIDLDLTLQRTLQPLLAEAQLKSSAASSAQSLATIESYLADRTVKPTERRHGHLIRVRALQALQRWEDSRKAIDDAAGEVTRDHDTTNDETEFLDNLTLLRGVLEIKKAIVRYGPHATSDFEDRTPAMEDLSETITQLAELQRRATPKLAAKAQLWIARAYLCQGMPDRALSNLTAVRQQRPFGAEGIAGSVEEIELLSKAGRGVETLQTTRFVMRELDGRRGFDPELVSFDEFRSRLIEAFDVLRRSGDYETSIDIARSLPPVFRRSDALMQEGQSYYEWGESISGDADNLSTEAAREVATIARRRFRAAGDAYSEAAELEFDNDQYVPRLWQAIDAYQQGRHFTRSIELLKPYLRYEDRRRKPRGMVAYGRALLAVGKPESAIKSLIDCVIEYPRDPLRYDARLMAAHAKADSGEIDDARRYLVDNLLDGELTPQSPAWRDSLFTLGELLFERGYKNHLLAQQARPDEREAMLKDNQLILDDAIRRLDEAVKRYWPQPRAESAMYLAARAHVLAAKWPRMEAESPEILETAKRTLRAQSDTELETALTSFISLREHLARREDERRLLGHEEAILRNCYIAEADTLREMGRFAEAAAAYRSVSLRFMNEPPALEAILGQARCMRQLGRPDDAQLLVRQANAILSRIPPEMDDQFAKVTRYDRKGWENLLKWMNERIDYADLGA